MEIYPKEGPLVWEVLETTDWTVQDSNQEGFGQEARTLETITVEIEATLNDNRSRLCLLN